MQETHQNFKNILKFHYKKRRIKPQVDLPPMQETRSNWSELPISLPSSQSVNILPLQALWVLSERNYNIVLLLKFHLTKYCVLLDLKFPAPYNCCAIFSKTYLGWFFIEPYILITQGNENVALKSLNHSFFCLKIHPLGYKFPDWCTGAWHLWS